MIKLAVDTGGANTKFSYFRDNEYRAGLFPTIIQKIKSTDTITEGIKVEFNGDSYLFPTSGSHYLTRNNTKLHSNHIIAVYTAIAKCINGLKLDPKETHPIDLSINIPIVDYKNKDNKEKYINKYENENINISVDDEDFTFNIKKVRPYFESQGCLLRYFENYEDKDVLIIDLGGRNDSMCLFKKGLPQGSCSFSGSEGLLKYLLRVANDLSGSGIKYTIDNVRDFKTGTIAPKPDNFNEIFSKHFNDYLHELNNKLVGYEINYQLTDVMFTGGGAVLLKNNIKEYFDKDIKKLVVNATDGWADNVKGALRRALSDNKEK